MDAGRSLRLAFTVQVAAAAEETPLELDRVLRGLRDELRNREIGAVERAGLERRGGGLAWGQLRVRLLPQNLPALLEFMHLWSLEPGGRLVRIQPWSEAPQAEAQVDMLPRYHTLSARGQAGGAEDVDHLMAVLEAQDDLATSRLVDFALGLVEAAEGRERLRHYLFEGTLRQRNYAALYFKRRGAREVLEAAVRAGRVDTQQAFSE